MPNVHTCIAALALLCLPACVNAQSDGIDASAVAADVTEWENWLFATHPQPEFSMDVGDVRARFDQVRDGLEGPYSRREAWLALAVLNPHFADGHVTLRLPSEEYEAWLADGGADFSLPVRIEGDQLRVADTIAEESRVRAGETITVINDQPVGPLIAAAVSRANGDTPGLRRHVVETRFASYLWALTGGAADWQVTAQNTHGQTRTITLDPQRERAGQDPEPWSLAFQDDAAILTLNTFAPTVEAEFDAFIDASFAEITARGSEILVIDISENGGGAHMLSDHLLAYLTDQRHTPLSAVTARITPENQALIPGSEPGQVISMPFAQWVEPPAEQANRFEGRFAFLVGAGTYSQAIVLAATVQDFDIAPIAGPGTEGRANSTGQVQLHRLANTDLEAAAPIYVFTRASGDSSSAPIIPDLPLSGSRDAQIDALIAHLRTH
ncbi:S41 family peptidase [uncultured Maricaulis sp.]|uniref:S41 family peptidase n=1 Tax=uncultured Maricaulis sp. TaxID=174710 RepID=UPI0026190F2F|nr:S41 family peptidase [uncultured Maricaulis sp.]